MKWLRGDGKGLREQLLIFSRLPPSMSIDYLRRRWPTPVLVIVLAIAGTTLAVLSDPLLINPDTVQLISAASNLLDGNGLSSSIIYYDAQHEAEHLPVPLTVWPPGFAWLLAAGKVLGLELETSAIIIAILFHLLSAAAMFAVGRVIGLSGAMSLVPCMAWLIQVHAWNVTLAAYSETLFIFLTLFSTYLLLKSWQVDRAVNSYVLWSGVAAAAAMLVRYTGVFWIAGICAWFLLQYMRRKRPAILRSMLMFVIPPLTAMILLFGRNHATTGRWSGGQFDFGDAVDWVNALRTAFWEFAPMVLPGGSELSTPVVLVILTVIASAAIGQYGARTMRKAEESTRAISRRFLELSAAYMLVVMGFMVLSAVTHSAGAINYRYFLPVLPFILIPVTLVAMKIIEWTRRQETIDRRSLGALISLIVTMPLWGQALGLLSHWPPVPLHPDLEDLRTGLLERTQHGSTVRDFLEQRVGRRFILLAQHEHRVALLTGLPVLGLTDARFTRKTWTEAQVVRLLRRRGVELVLFFPGTFKPSDPANSNLEFYRQLADGNYPSWLAPLHVTDQVALFLVQGSLLSGATSDVSPR